MSPNTIPIAASAAGGMARRCRIGMLSIGMVMSDVLLHQIDEPPPGHSVRFNWQMLGYNGQTRIPHDEILWDMVLARISPAAWRRPSTMSRFRPSRPGLVR